VSKFEFEQKVELSKKKNFQKKIKKIPKNFLLLWGLSEGYRKSILMFRSIRKSKFEQKVELFEKKFKKKN
jgi:hypothetical protein